MRPSRTPNLVYTTIRRFEADCWSPVLLELIEIESVLKAMVLGDLRRFEEQRAYEPGADKRWVDDTIQRYDGMMRRLPDPAW